MEMGPSAHHIHANLFFTVITFAYILQYLTYLSVSMPFKSCHCIRFHHHLWQHVPDIGHSWCKHFSPQIPIKLILLTFNFWPPVLIPLPGQKIQSSISRSLNFIYFYQVAPQPPLLQKK